MVTKFINGCRMVWDLICGTSWSYKWRNEKVRAGRKFAILPNWCCLIFITVLSLVILALFQWLNLRFFFNLALISKQRCQITILSKHFFMCIVLRIVILDICFGDLSQKYKPFWDYIIFIKFNTSIWQSFYFKKMKKIMHCFLLILPILKYNFVKYSTPLFISASGCARAQKDHPHSLHFLPFPADF